MSAAKKQLPPGGEEMARDLAFNIKSAEAAMEEAKEYIAMMREAGEDVSQALKDLTTQKVRIGNWRRMLKARGIDVDKVTLPEEE